MGGVVFISDKILVDIIWCIIGGCACFATSFLVVGFRSPRIGLERRIEYGLASALGAFAVNMLALKYFPDKIEPTDAPAYSILIALFGLTRILNFIAKKYGLGDKQ